MVTKDLGGLGIERPTRAPRLGKAQTLGMGARRKRTSARAGDTDLGKLVCVLLMLISAPFCALMLVTVGPFALRLLLSLLRAVVAY